MTLVPAASSSKERPNCISNLQPTTEATLPRACFTSSRLLFSLTGRPARVSAAVCPAGLPPCICLCLLLPQPETRSQRSPSQGATHQQVGWVDRDTQCLPQPRSTRDSKHLASPSGTPRPYSCPQPCVPESELTSWNPIPVRGVLA